MIKGRGEGWWGGEEQSIKKIENERKSNYKKNLKLKLVKLYVPYNK